MVTQRTTGGNTVYFMGMVSAAGWWYYFPVVYFLKLPLAFHFLTIMALLGAISLIKKPFYTEPLQKLKKWVSNHFTEFSMMIFLIIYWLASMTGNLNIGVRHILPSFPFVYILVCLAIKNRIEVIKKTNLKKMAVFLVSVLLGFYVISSITSFPYYLSYFNEISGGVKNGYKYVVDSNYDWGQDLKRLTKFVEQNKIEKIYIDYFGGSNPKYYLKEKCEYWQGTKSSDEFPKNNYLAVSATLLQGGRGNPALNFDQPTNYYLWLNKYQPITRIGTSIFVYYID